MYEIILSKGAIRFLKKLDKKTWTRLLLAIERLRFRPDSHVTMLVGEQGYRFRVGDYRIIIDIDHGKLLILVIDVGHRKNVYKK